MTKITETELTELREKAAKWDKYIESRKRANAVRSPEQRKASAKKAIDARWEKYRAAKRRETADATPPLVTKEEMLEVQRRLEAEDRAEMDAFIKRRETKNQE